ncbi:MAG: DUF2066 domain-containing protein [Rhodospirillales bacterium]|nr:DUF2066 domain-containing protein [Rhodospirillales bacterium]
MRDRLTFPRTFWLFVVALATVWLSAAPTADAAGQVLTIRNVAVDESAGDASEARRVAIANAQRIAWNRLIERMVTGDISLVDEPDAATLETIVQSLEFADEKITTGRYRANVTVRFRSDSVLAWLGNSGVPHLVVPTPVMLVLPVLQTTEGNQLWEEVNPWLRAWQQRPGSGFAVKIISPVADLNDLLAIDADGALAGDWSKMQVLLARYEVDGILVAVAQPTASRLGQTLTWYEGPEGETIPMSILLEPPPGVLDGVTDGEVEATETVVDISAQDYIAAVDTTRQGVSDYWTAATYVPDGVEAAMVAEIPVRSLGEWVDIRSRLAQPAVLTETLPLVVSVDRVRILLRYVGTLEELRAGLRRVGLGLSAQGDNWIILPL